MFIVNNLGNKSHSLCVLADEIHLALILKDMSVIISFRKNNLIPGQQNVYYLKTNTNFLDNTTSYLLRPFELCLLRFKAL